MKFLKLLTAAALVSAAFVTKPAVAEDITLEFVVWNYSLETLQDNVKQFEAANPGIKVKVTDYTWPDYHDSLAAFLWRHAYRRDLRRSGLVAGLGRGRIRGAAGPHRACGRG